MSARTAEAGILNNSPGTIPQDAADVALAQSGDAQAFERLYRAQVNKIHSLARRMAGPAEADELTQDVFVRAWQKLHTFRGEAAFGTWLHRLGVNVILAYRARREPVGAIWTRMPMRPTSGWRGPRRWS
jgi:RNA polymerase sigma-70 factor (ECF subfamily)